MKFLSLIDLIIITPIKILGSSLVSVLTRQETVFSVEDSELYNKNEKALIKNAIDSMMEKRINNSDSNLKNSIKIIELENGKTLQITI